MYLIAVNCGRLDVPLNGKIRKTTGDTFGKVYSFICNEADGYLMKGSKERRCLANVTWSGVQPECYRKYSLLVLFSFQYNCCDFTLSLSSVCFIFTRLKKAYQKIRREICDWLREFNPSRRDTLFDRMLVHHKVTPLFDSPVTITLPGEANCDSNVST